MTDRQKLGTILENKVVQKLKQENNVFFYKTWSPKLLFFNEFLTSKIDFKVRFWNFLTNRLIFYFFFL